MLLCHGSSGLCMHWREDHLDAGLAFWWGVDVWLVAADLTAGSAGLTGRGLTRESCGCCLEMLQSPR